MSDLDETVWSGSTMLALQKMVYDEGSVLLVTECYFSTALETPVYVSHVYDGRICYRR